MKTLTEKQVLKAPESEYMNDQQLDFFKSLLIELHNATHERIEETKNEMNSPPEFNDENDRASWEEQCLLSLRILDREQKLLPKIKQSLERIRLGKNSLWFL